MVHHFEEYHSFSGRSRHSLYSLSCLLLAVFDGHFRSIVGCFLDVFLKLLALFVSHHGNYSLFLLAVFLLFLSAVLEALLFCWLSFRCFVGHLGILLSAILEAYCRLSWKLIVGRLGSLLLAILEAYCWLSWKLLGRKVKGRLRQASYVRRLVCLLTPRLKVSCVVLP